jgi:hypothetical protein
MGANQKFLAGTWPIFRIEPDAPLFQLGQDRTAIVKLSDLGTGLGNAVKIQIDVGKTTY